MRVLLSALVLFCFSESRAGAIELGASANYRSTSYDATNYVRALSYTGSITYYLSEHFAVESNYTSGYSKEFVKGPAESDPAQVLEDDFTMVALDIVISPASGGSIFRPYLKLGAGYLTKTRYFQLQDTPRAIVSKDHGWVPSAGIGVAMNLTNYFNIKAGLEAWTSEPLTRHSTLDYAARAGMGFRF